MLDNKAQLLAEIAEATDNNHHTRARILIATALGEQVAVKKLELVEKLHELEGWMPQELSAYRDSIMERMRKRHPIDMVYLERGL